MQQIINFIIRNKTFLFFLLLLFISLAFTIQSHSYHRSQFIHSANFLSGGIYESAHNISGYFELQKKNTQLVEENKRLRTLIFNSKDSIPNLNLGMTIDDNQFKFRAAEVIKNSYSSTNNYLLLDKGEKDSIKQDFGVISSNGLIGIVDKTSNGFSKVISILNSNSRINAQLKKTNHFGTLRWNGESPQIVQLIDIPKTAPIQIGDTIITGGRSIIFPKGILIGSVTSFSLDASGDFYEVQIRLFNDMTSIGHVYIIENLHAEELLNLELLDE